MLQELVSAVTTYKKITILMLELHIDTYGPQSTIYLLKNQNYNKKNIVEISQLLKQKKDLLKILNKKKGTL
jgi:hypothetical protein